MKIPSIETNCTDCSHPVVVLAPTMGQVRRREDEPERVEIPDAPPGGDRVEADHEGWFTCPRCGVRNRVNLASAS
jgi:hypothetical protein